MTAITRTLLAGSLLGLAACEGEQTGEGTNPGSERAPSPYIFDPGDPPEPTEALDAVEGALQSAFDLALLANAGAVRTAYDEVLAYSNDQCPYYYATEAGSYWLDSCSSDSGAFFDGYVFSADLAQTQPQTGFLIETWYVSGGAAMMDPSGNLLEVGGTAVVQNTSGFVGPKGDIPFVQYASQLQGSFAWDGASAEGTFLGEGLDPDLGLQLQDFAGFGRTALVSGGFGGFDGGWAVAFDENTLFTESLGSSCSGELSGTVAVRSPLGEWYDVRFDGPTSENDVVAPADCDGCGTAYFQGEEVGLVCADPEALLSWGGTPW